MKKIKAQCKLIRTGDNYELILLGRSSVISKMIEYHVTNHEKFQQKYFDLEFKPVASYKTNKQIGYWYGEIVPKAEFGYTSAGWNGMDEKKAERMLKEQCGFTELVINDITDETKVEVKSISDATQDEMKDLIDQAIMFIEQDLGIDVESPEDYKKRNLNTNYE